VEVVEVSDELEDILDRAEQREEPERILTGPATELDFFQAVYLNENLPLGYRLKAAAERAKYTHAQLRAVHIGHLDQNSFAAALERAILRSQSQYVPRALPAPEQHPASELKGNFPVRRRNLR
jgi:hypothetical protein